MKVNIKVPIWNGNKVGVATRNLADKNGTLEVEVLYKDKDGNRVFPLLYCMSNQKALTYPVHKGYGRVPDLVYIPLRDFEAKEIVVEAPKELTQDEKDKQAYMQSQGLA